MVECHFNEESLSLSHFLDHYLITRYVFSKKDASQWSLYMNLFVVVYVLCLLPVPSSLCT